MLIWKERESPAHFQKVISNVDRQAAGADLCHLIQNQTLRGALSFTLQSPPGCHRAEQVLPETVPLESRLELCQGGGGAGFGEGRILQHAAKG